MYLSEFPKSITIPVKAQSAQTGLKINYEQKRTYRTDDYKAYKKAISSFLKLHGIKPLPRNKAVILDITFVFKSTVKYKHGCYHINRPDRDNLEKAVQDAMTGIVYADDSQVCDGRIKKVYGPESAIILRCRTN